MLEGSIMEIVKYWMYMMLLVIATTLFIFFYQASQTTRFEGYVNAQIERHGGLTETAAENIQQENIENYGGRYTVIPNVKNSSSKLTDSTIKSDKSIDKTNFDKTFKSSNIILMDSNNDGVLEPKATPLTSAYDLIYGSTPSPDGYLTYYQTDALNYGDILAYDVVASYSFFISWIDDVELTSSSEALVQVRGNS